MGLGFSLLSSFVVEIVWGWYIFAFQCSYISRGGGSLHMLLIGVSRVFNFIIGARISPGCVKSLEMYIE